MRARKPPLGNVEQLGDGGPAAAARLMHPEGIAIGTDGSMYIADVRHLRVRKVDSAGLVTTVAGDGWSRGRAPYHHRGRFVGDDGPALNASFDHPCGLAVGLDGSLYIADRGNHRVRKVSPDGRICTLAGCATRP
jgi:streptogramin lyase